MEDNSSGRLSKESVERLHSSNPERGKLFELVGGMPVFLPEGFISNGRVEPSFSSSYTSARQAVNRMFMGIHDAGQAILLPYKVVIEIEGLHLATASRADKENKDSGRPIMDMTNVKGTPVNSDFSKQSADEKWGEIQGPYTGQLAVGRTGRRLFC